MIALRPETATRINANNANCFGFIENCGSPGMSLARTADHVASEARSPILQVRLPGVYPRSIPERANKGCGGLQALAGQKTEQALELLPVIEVSIAVPSRHSRIARDVVGREYQSAVLIAGEILIKD